MRRAKKVKRILVVEDNEANLYLIRLCLRKADRRSLRQGRVL